MKTRGRKDDSGDSPVAAAGWAVSIRITRLLGHFVCGSDRRV